MPAGLEEDGQTMLIRAAQRADAPGLWRILEPMIRAGESYPLPRDMSEADALAYWFQPMHAVFVAEAEGALLGTYYMRANQTGAGAHVANCGYVTAREATGHGVAQAMCRHSLEEAHRRGFRAMQFNFVAASNERAVRLWTKMGFATVGRIPRAFAHPSLGFVDALVMWREL
jgi:ribosomal protein S18 acetylase RimI-like enzyme